MTTETALVPVEQPKPVVAIRDALEKRTAALMALLDYPDAVRRFQYVATMAVSKNPDIQECSGESVLRSILEAAELGLEPTGAIGGAHLVPFKAKGSNVKQAQLILDYRGTQHLIREGGGGEVVAQLVYEGDDFRVAMGTRPGIEHAPHFLTVDPTKITHVYAYPLDNREKFEVMTKQQIDLVRSRSKASNAGPWVSDYGQMARKTCIKRLANYLELKPRTREVIERDTQREFGDDVAPAEPTPTRASAIRAQLAERLKSAPGAPETPEVADDAAPDVSADEQTPTEPTGDACGDPPIDAEVHEVPAEAPLGVCGVLDEQLGCGPCILPLGHKGKPHTDAEGSVWPNR
jgi:recombination protein RecT